MLENNAINQMHFNFLVNSANLNERKDHLGKEYLRTLLTLRNNDTTKPWSLILGQQINNIPVMKVSTFKEEWSHRFLKPLIWKTVPAGRNWQ